MIAARAREAATGAALGLVVGMLLVAAFACRPPAILAPVGEDAGPCGYLGTTCPGGGCCVDGMRCSVGGGCEVEPPGPEFLARASDAAAE